MFVVEDVHQYMYAESTYYIELLLKVPIARVESTTMHECFTSGQLGSNADFRIPK